jgi:lipopolysaccharide export LptBFGC system permease protein LptF
MSKTLFWYLFRDLIRIFFMASGTLAAIMSFGGLMRPLTENGLNAGQVGKMLACLMPAMTAYSLPAAALFATTVVFGRLAADNELTACRAAGMSYLAIGLPAVVFSLLISILSLLLLCFVVPVYSLKVEQVIYSNLAQVVVNTIQREHEIRLGSDYPTVFAEEAHLLPSDPNQPGEQMAHLTGPTIVTYVPGGPENSLHIPKDFYTAESATVRIHPSDENSASGGVRLDMDLVGGAKFPRAFTASDRNQLGVETVTPPPMFLDNPIRQNYKFMDIWELMRLDADPSGSERIQQAVADLLRREQERTYLSHLAADQAGLGAYSLRSAASPGKAYILTTQGAGPVLRQDDLIFRSADAASPSGPVSRQVRLTVVDWEQVTRVAQANEATLRARADEADGLISVTVELRDVLMRVSDAQNKAGGLPIEPAELPTWEATIDVPMEDSIKQLKQTRTLAAYINDRSLDERDSNHIRREEVLAKNEVRAELHGRASFAVSCLILVLVGCALGMMFKSGNFLAAFAISFAPALLCIALVVAGQQTASHVPEVIARKFIDHDQPLKLGLCVIWSGNVLVLGMAVGLIARLRRR